MAGYLSAAVCSKMGHSNFKPPRNFQIALKSAWGFYRELKTLRNLYNQMEGDQYNPL